MNPELNDGDWLDCWYC